MHRSPHTDIASGGWMDRHVPVAVRPYLLLMRLDRPIGTWLLLLPCFWGLAVAPRPDGFGWQDVRLAVLFALGAVIMRGAGCVVNDLADRDLDRLVERTAGRPLASGAVSVPQALALLAGLLAAGLAVLLQFNWTTIGVGAASLLLVAVYPLMKRVTYWPQAFLGLTFNWGALLGWTAVTGSLSPPAILLYAAGFFWTIGYDTIYAHQDRDDDLKVGIKSTAIRFAGHSRSLIAASYAAATTLIAATALAAGLGWAVWPGLACFAAHAAWQVRDLDENDRARCLALFRSNRDAGLIVAAALLAGRALSLG